MSSPREFDSVPISFLIFVALLWTTLPAPAQSPLPPVPDRPLRLADCLALSEGRQPSLIATRCRLAAAYSGLASLEEMRGGPLRRDLPIRRQQAQLGIAAAQADLARIQVENRYVVTRAYLSVLYSRAQRKVIDELIDDLDYLRQRVQAGVEKKERPEWTTATVDLITLYLHRAEARRAEANRGLALSLAALRESLDLGPEVCLNVADEPIPQPAVSVCREEIIAAAVARRGEAIQANLAVEVGDLEIQAQAKHRHERPVNTFAAVSDLHARNVPQPSYGEEFRPGGIPLAMPHVLVGPTARRVETAQNFNGQIAAIAHKTRNLLILEAEEAYQLWQEWSQKVHVLRAAQKVGVRLGSELHEEFRGPIKRVLETALPQSLLAAQARTDFNEALFRQAISLAALERVTGGVFCAGLEK